MELWRGQDRGHRNLVLPSSLAPQPAGLLWHKDPAAFQGTPVYLYLPMKVS